MQCNYLQLTTCFFISVYLSKINVDASVVKDRDTSNEVANQQKGDTGLDILYFAKFKCPNKFGAFPDIEDCGKFYICVAGFSRHMPCPPFHHFDKHRRRCMSILVAVCDKGEEEEITPPEEETTPPEEETTPTDDNGNTDENPEFVCPEMVGKFSHSKDCSKYHECESFVASLKTCPEKELFDGVKKECRPESEVNCGSRERATKSTPPEVITTPELTTPEVSVPTTPVVEPTTPVVEEQTAPETDCDEDDLDCIITETGEIPKWFKCPVELGSYRHPSSKKLFIFCINWKPYVKRCGQDLIYSQELRTCIPLEYPE